MNIYQIWYVLFALILSGCSLDATLLSSSSSTLSGNNEQKPEGSLSTRISAGASHTCLIKNDHTVWCWGDNSYGQLGDGTTLSTTSPVQVIDPGVLYKSISVSDNFSCGITTTNSARCWGHNNTGQLGDGTTNESHVPTQVLGLEANVLSISAAGEKWGNYGYACAVLMDMTLQCWGSHPANIGDGTQYSLTPVSFSGLSNVIQVSSSRGHTCALLKSKSAVCWGGNQTGQLGDGTGISSNSPVAVSGLTNIKRIVAGSSAWMNDGISCALLESGQVQCWGSNHSGTLGNGDNAVTHSLVPIEVVGLSDIKDINIGYGNDSNGNGTACAITSNGDLYCWGSNSTGMVGDGTTSPTYTPLKVANLSGVQISIALGEGGDNGSGHSCALNAQEHYSCWGANYAGQLGDGTTSSRLSP
ncbi:hypothetical protein EZJ49_05795 [Bdellovibrio bacteriovorus]|uniref:RCC1 domain-containing protein n=1 Tax=Bdellovibrio bacteriovorus TaxID=959 RepID=UPI0021CF6D77|nr:hypothetical protein [Bdellovibrio bacteriovorus]UXR65760.1 hypothetical protein EZJ49_05795 [Bdellovibrio bacteriovorus]